MSRRVIPLLIIAFALLLLWLSAPSWLAWMVRAQLQQAGFSHISCDIDHVGLSELRIRRLSAERNHAQIGIEATQITVRYRLAALLHQHVSSVHIDQLTVSVHTSATIGTGSGGLIVLSQLALLRQLPFDQAAIDSIRLLHFNRRQQSDLELDGHAIYEHNRIDLQLQDRAATQLARLNLDQHGTFTLRLQHEQQPALIMRGTVQAQQQRLRMDADMHIDLASINALLMRWGLQLDLQPAGNLDIRGHVSLPRNQPLTRDLLAQLIAKLNIRLQADLLDNSAGADIAGELEITDGEGRWHIRDGAEIHVGQHKTSRTTLTASRLAGTLSFASSQPLLVLQYPSHLEINNLAWNDWVIPRTSISLAREMHVSLANSGTLLQPTELHIDIPAIRQGKIRLALPDMRIQLQPDKVETLRGQIHAPRITLTTAQTTLGLEQMRATFRLKQQQLSAQWQAEMTPRLARLDGDISIDMQNGVGQLHYRTDNINVRQRQAAIQTWLTGFVPQIALQEGNIQASGNIRWQADTLLAQAHLQLDTLGGSWQQQTFRGLQATCRLRYDGNSIVLQPSDITLNYLKGAIPLQEISMQLAASWPLNATPAITIKHFSTRLLGGMARTPEVILHSERPHNPFSIQLEHIDLAEVIALEQQQGLQVQGYLNGTLPLDMTPNGLRLQHGRLHVMPPGGIIRYTGSASVRQMAASNMGIDLALQVLSDFRYQRMDIEADYDPEGILTLAIQLKGHNPAYENGRPITFNLNIEENVLQLIKSLQLADDIEKNMRKKLRGE